MSIWMVLKKEEFQSKEKVCSLLMGKKISEKEHEHVLKVWDSLKWKRWKNVYAMVSWWVWKI